MAGCVGGAGVAGDVGSMAHGSTVKACRAGPRFTRVTSTSRATCTDCSMRDSNMCFPTWCYEHSMRFGRLLKTSLQDCLCSSDMQAIWPTSLSRFEVLPTTSRLGHIIGRSSCEEKRCQLEWSSPACALQTDVYVK